MNPAAADVTWRFGAFELSPSRRQLLAEGRAVALGGRAFDILAALVERAGRVVPREELTARVWPRTVVEESSLRVQVALLRRALGPAAAFVVTVPGRGYTFVAGVSEVADEPPSAPAAGPAVATLPLRLSDLVGRDDVVAALRGRLGAHRLVTVTGPGGVGKSAVMLAVAEGVSGAFPGGLLYVDAGDGALISGMPQCGEAAGRRLVVLDNCDGDIDAAAAAAASLLDTCAHTVVFASAREPLRLAGEQVVRLAPLALPPPHVRTAAAALRSPAVRLFVDRARTRQDRFTLSDRDAPLVATLCHRLDGMPLALEMAAAAIDVLGLRGVLDQADGDFALLERCRRTPHARQRSLRASLDWTHARLGARDQAVFRRLSVLDGAFTLGEAVAAAAHGGLDEAAVVASVGALVAASLVVRDTAPDGALYRLHGATRAYAAGHLAASGDPAAPAPLQEFTASS